MKTAKEWAESVMVSGQDYGWAKTNGDAAREVVERLVERVQADARAPLEEEVARLCEENGKMRAAVIAARDVCLAHDWDMMSSDGDYERTLVDAIKATGLEYS